MMRFVDAAERSERSYITRKETLEAVAVKSVRDFVAACKMVFVSPGDGTLGASKGGVPGGSPRLLETGCPMWQTWTAPQVVRRDVRQSSDPAKSRSLASAARTAAFTAASLPPTCSSHQRRPAPSASGASALWRIRRTFRCRWPWNSLMSLVMASGSKESPATISHNVSCCKSSQGGLAGGAPRARQPPRSNNCTSSACTNW
mmetsp:Transcript_104902/g.326065  ORF Transcript_104902/g.326065 Transcript_104902/m.326065 type:complete len:202 (-) Transcript_104902:1160-1765(-)